MIGRHSITHPVIKAMEGCLLDDPCFFWIGDLQRAKYLFYFASGKITLYARHFDLGSQALNAGAMCFAIVDTAPSDCDPAAEWSQFRAVPERGDACRWGRPVIKELLYAKGTVLPLNKRSDTARVGARPWSLTYCSSIDAGRPPWGLFFAQCCEAKMAVRWKPFGHQYHEIC